MSGESFESGGGSPGTSSFFPNRATAGGMACEVSAGHARVVRATALDEETRRRVLQAPGTAGTVHSVFAHVMNLKWHDGRLLALHGPGVLRAPFAVALADCSALDQVAPGTPVMHAGGCIGLGDIQVDIAPALVRDLRLYPGLRSASEARTVLANLPEISLDRGLGAGRLRDIQERIGEGLRRRDPVRLLRGLKALVGLGGGLTPAGDDCIVGVLAALHVFAGGLDDTIRVGLASAVGETTWLAREFLLSALGGRFAEPLVRLCTGGRAEAERAIAELLAFGATSGEDTLRGLRLAVVALAG
jgi:uncharacterized protein DUF2877